MPPIKIFSLSTKWGARSSPSVLACFVSNSSFVYIFLPIQIRQTHDVWTQFHNFALSKTKFLSSPSKQLRCIHGGAKDEDIDLFQRSRRRHFCPTSRPWYLLYAMQIARESGSDDAGIVPVLGLSLSDISWCWPAPRNWRRKKPITSRAGKISIARTNFLPARFLRHRYVSTLIS